VKSVLIDHSGERGFCAGGDIRMIAESGAGDASEAKAFFKAEYQLNHLLFDYPKPVTAIVDGIVMGGGVGISEPATVRIATERTTYAMPETGIGLFPDVGGGWFLPRLPGQTGVWLALTGARLKAADTVFLGIHTHYLPTDALEAFRAILSADPAYPAMSPTGWRTTRARRRSRRIWTPSTVCSPSTRSSRSSPRSKPTAPNGRWPSWRCSRPSRRSR
jgi:enoyl-CoA hydratase